MRWLSLSLTLCLGLSLSARADEPIQVWIQGSGGRDYQVAVQRFAADAQSASFVEPLHGDLTAAIQFSGSFKPVDPTAFLEPLQTEHFGEALIPCDNWQAIGADVLIQGRIEREGRKQRVRYRIWDVDRCRLQGDPAYFEAEPDLLGYLARRIADDLVFRFTGRRGVAATQIAFVSDRDGNKEIYLMEADGSNVRRVTRNRQINLFPAWSPDGATLLYTSYRAGAPDLWMLSRGRTGGRLLDMPHEKYRGVFGPIDGQVTFVMNRRGNTDLYIARQDGRGLRRLTRSRAIDVSPTWSPDGQKLAFASDRSGSQQIYLRDMTDGAVRRLTFRGSYNASPAWSPTGDWIAFAARTGSGNFDLYLIDPETGYTTQLTDHPHSEEDPAWSPNGRKIAFSSPRRGRRDLYIVDVDGRNLRRITDGLGNSSNPAWSSWLD